MVCFITKGSFVLDAGNVGEVSGSGKYRGGETHGYNASSMVQNPAEMCKNTVGRDRELEDSLRELDYFSPTFRMKRMTEIRLPMNPSDAPTATSTA
jgi:hypothetical protein